MNNFTVLPELIIFGLDFILWPEVSHFIKYPCTRKNGSIIDMKENDIVCYPEVPAVLDRLNNTNIKLAIAQRVTPFRNNTLEKLKNGIMQLINLFGFDKYISFIEIDSEPELDYIIKLQEKARVWYDKMILFNGDILDDRPVRRMGVLIKYTYSDKGLTMELLNNALAEYERRRTKS